MVAQTLRRRLGCEVELVEVVTTGDRSSAPIETLGGTGVFVSALRDALLGGEVDLAVHSLKDLPTAPADGLELAAVPPRARPEDVLVCPDGRRLAELGPTDRVGTGSPRRAAQLRALGQGFEVVAIRGNVDTRIKKAIDGDVDAVVLAYAGLERLDRLDAVTEILDVDVVTPAPGQGALAIECLRDQIGPVGDEGSKKDLAELLRFVLNDAPSSVAVTAERAFLAAVEAGCTAPVGALAEIVSCPGAVPREADRTGAPAVDEIRLGAVVASPDGRSVLRRRVTGPAVDPEALGKRLADELLSAGVHMLIGNC
jgi:hydroxymethylbilane synthase